MFQILECLDKLHGVKHYSTWVLAECPICGGKLKISKNPSRYGAYACYTNGCHENKNNPIKKLLYKPGAFRESSVFTYKKKTRSLIEVVKPLPVQGEADDFFTSVCYIPPKQLKEHNKIITYFEYDGFRIVRLDAKLSDGTRKKYIYPEYQQNGEFIHGLPSNLSAVPIYQGKYIQSCMVFMEGEKATTIGQKLNIAAATFPVFAFSERLIYEYVNKLKDLGLKNVLYLEDNDVTGRKKSDLLSKAFWKFGIHSSSFNLTDMYTEYKDISGFDFYDAYKFGLVDKDNVVNVLGHALRCSVPQN